MLHEDNQQIKFGVLMTIVIMWFLLANSDESVEIMSKVISKCEEYNKNYKE